MGDVEAGFGLLPLPAGAVLGAGSPVQAVQPAGTLEPTSTAAQAITAPTVSQVCAHATIT